MVKRWFYASVLALMVLAVALPALAAQGGIGGVHFGPYSLAAGDSVTGDLVVFGPVTLGRDSTLTGDLVAFGELEMREGARVRGDMAVFGAAEIAGTVAGDIFSAGELQLRATARVEGNVSSAGAVTKDPAAVVEGQIARVEGIRGFNWRFPFGRITIDGEDGPSAPTVEVRQPLWLRMLWKMARGLLTIIVLGLFALFFASLWPRHVERVAETVVNVPLPSFGVGLLALIGAGLVLAVLAITICLSPLALVGGVIVGVGAVLGWIALGSVLGDRVLRGLLNAEKVTPVTAAVLGTVLLTILAVLVDVVSSCLYAILIWPLVALGAGAVVLTRFGTMPYAATGNVRPPAPPSAVSPRSPAAPPRPIEPVVPVAAESVTSKTPEESEHFDELPSPFGEDADQDQ